MDRWTDMINPTTNSFCALHARYAVKYNNVKPPS